MACDIKIQTSVFNRETGEMEDRLTSITTTPGSQVSEDAIITMDTLADLVTKLSADERANLAALLQKAKTQTLTSEMIKNNIFIGNTTIDELLTIYPSLTGEFNINNELYSNYNILRCKNFKLGNIEYNGRVITADGKELFIIKDENGARNFVKYLQGKEAAEAAFMEGGKIPSVITKDLIDQLDAIKEHNHLNSRLDTVMKWLRNRDSLKPFTSNGEVITPRQVVGKIISLLTDQYNYDEALTDFELALSGIKTNTSARNKYRWRLPKATMYKVIAQYYPEFGEQYSLEEFRDWTTEQLTEHLFGRGGIFYGNPKLDRATITEVTQGSRTVEEDTEEIQFINLKAEQKDAAWEAIKNNIAEQAKNAKGKAKAAAEKWLKDNEKVKRVTFERAHPEEFIKLLNQIKIQYTNSKGEAVTVRASRVTDEKTGQLVNKIGYDDVKIKRGKVKETPSYITLSFQKATLGDIYNFGYETQFIFNPVNSEDLNIQNGHYNGMRIYQALINDRPVYAISRSILSPKANMQTFPTLEAAMHAIDNHLQKDIISKNSLLSLKTVDGIPRQIKVELEGVQVGQIISSMDVDLHNFKLSQMNQLPTTFRQLFDSTVPKFRETLSAIPGIDAIQTPEQAATFLARVINRMSNDDLVWLVKQSNRDVIDFLATSEMSEITKAALDEVTGNKVKYNHYYVDVVKPGKTPLVTLTLMRDGEKTIEMNEANQMRIGDHSVNEFIGQVVDEASRSIAESYNIRVNTLTTSELVQRSIDNNWGLENKADSIKAFIHDGEIYINTSTANASDLYHEIAHLYLGALRAVSPEAYTALVELYKTTNTYGNFTSKYDYTKRIYRNFARPDIEEETIVSMIADRIMSNRGVLNPNEGERVQGNYSRFSPEAYTNLMEDIITQVNNFKQDLNTNGLGFDSIMKLVKENMDVQNKMKLRRAYSNLAHQMMEQGQIKEIC